MANPDKQSCETLLKIPISFNDMPSYIAHMHSIYKATKSRYLEGQLKKASATWACFLYTSGSAKKSLEVWEFCKQMHENAFIAEIEMGRLLCLARLKEFPEAMRVAKALEENEAQLTEKQKNQIFMVIVQLFLSMKQALPFEYRKRIPRGHAFEKFIAKQQIELITQSDESLQRGDPQFALKLLKFCATTDADVWWLWEKMGDIHRTHLAEKKAAQKCYQRAVELLEETSPEKVSINSKMLF